ncbi:LuxR C-terminal-related transcriptional regulator [Solwaraspora sp. WMMD406]|uniref:helix-turn-helix transcriptional regulator n=1 Tax=Solwaraspora sp. WMMD406 TaxID=3016095 RepID=UPI002417BF9C|nr:LuxR family transcriptional regulator [Solwaraspora sp. WMMD406]MDG4765982.1 LuxR C-terminal-related transcriptional regulator [Solwaraspora sp. WMMD406]
MDDTVVGRGMILDEVRRHLAARETVILDGPTGIGKTTCWTALLRWAARDGWLVLRCAPTEAETTVAYTALADLLSPLADQVSALPGPQRAAAEVVLLRADPTGPVDDRAIAAATRVLIDRVCADHRVLVAIDDAHWLDPPSERALRYALRRVSPTVAVLVSCRDTGSGPGPAPLGLDHGPDRPGPARVELGPLDVADLRQLLRARLGTALPRPLLNRIARDSGGNPLLAIELARAVLRLPRLPSPGADLPVVASTHPLVTRTLAALPAASREAVRLAALLTVPTVATLAAAGVSATDFEPAEEAGLVAVTEDTVTFPHPVYASAVRSSIPPGIRSRLRQHLALVVADPDERARHLAVATTTPDLAIADELTAAAGRQQARGAPELAAGLYDRAAELTPERFTTRRHAQRLAAARCRFAAGDYPAATEAAEAAAALTTGDLRAEALLLRAVISWSADDLAAAVTAATRGLAATTPGTPLAGRVHAHLSLFVDQPARSQQHAHAAITLLEGSATDRGLRSAALLQLFFHEVRGGLPPRTDLLDEALHLEGDEPSWLAATVPAVWWTAIDEHDRARDRLRQLLDWAVGRGDEPLQHDLLAHLGETELLAGRWSAAADHIAAARELGQQLGTSQVGESWLAGLLDAHRGRLVDAGEVARSGLRRADEIDDPWCRRIHQLLAGFVALSAGRMAEAAAHYRGLAATVDAVGLVEPLSTRFEPDWIEACVGAGDLIGARQVFDRLAERDHRLSRPWTRLGLARSRALIAAARGDDPDPALRELTAARDATPPEILPLDRARCLLVAGTVLRRTRRKRPARLALETALGEFTALGAAAFAARAGTELARVGGRPAAPRQLTGTEQQVAQLAATGCTNRVIADRLFVSPKTVEANLARVYRKLGISSRAELGAAMVDRPQPADR